MITFDDFKKLDLRVGEIVEVEEIEEANKLYKMKVDVGEEKRQVLAGVKKFYDMDELEGKKVVMVVNLEPKEMFGFESQGMILAAGEEARLLTTDGQVENGSKVS
ncbi:MAG: methionine--tRNA ligase subunit beta [Patescibacteria group bacterium]